MAIFTTEASAKIKIISFSDYELDLPTQEYDYETEEGDYYEAENGDYYESENEEDVPLLPVSDYENYDETALRTGNVGNEAIPSNEDAEACPGGDLDTCIDVCPGFNKVAFGLCVAECGQRCP